MAHEQALEYIKQRTAQGVAREQIETELKANGWQEADIRDAFASPSGAPSVPAPYGPSLPGVGALLSEAWNIYTERLSTFLAIGVVPLAALGVLMLSPFATLFFAPTISSSGPVFPSSSFFAAFVIILILLGVLQLWGQIALIYATKETGIGFSEAYKKAWKMIPSMCWVSILSGIIMAGGLFLLVVPGIIFAVWFSLATIVLVAEDARGMTALFRSKEYVKGNWGEVFWRGFCIAVIAMAVSVVASFILGLIPYGDQFGQIVISFFLTPFTVIYLFTLYRHLKAKKGASTFVPTGGQKATFIVVGIVGILLIPIILGGIVFTSLSTARMKAGDARTRANINMLRVDLELYKEKNGVYPASLSDFTPTSGIKMTDPATGEIYRYTLDEKGGYRLCATQQTEAESCVASQY